MCTRYYLRRRRKTAGAGSAWLLWPATVGLFICALCAIACAPAASVPAHSAPNAAPTWRTTLDRGHPLVGKVWDAQRSQFVLASDLFRAVAEADFVVLGEKHDNPDHHALQARALGEMLARGRQPAVLLEMIDVDRQPAIDAYLAEPRASGAGFGAAMDWETRGWPTYTWYEPMLTIAMKARLPILAANLPLADARGIVRRGLGALDEATVRRLGLDQPFSKSQAAEVREEMRTSHCGHLPEEMLEPMALAQRARDAIMAWRMVEAKNGRSVVLIAGAGHGRIDRGVPAFIRARAPGARIVSVAFAEVERGVEVPNAQAFDFVWYTPRATDEDPCAAMRKPAR